MTDSKLRQFIPHTLIVLAALLVWGHTVSFDFVWDDKFFIQDLQSIRSLKNIPQMFYALDAQSSYPEGFVVFRPLRTVHYAILYQLGGRTEPEAWLFHLANVLWHAGAGLLLYSVALRLFGRLGPAEEEKSKVSLLALIAALAFTINPIVSETVCWAKSLDDIMATVFILAALRVLLENEITPRLYGWSIGFFALAVYSKVSAVPFPVIAFCLLVGWHRLKLWTAVRRVSGFAAVAMIFLIHNHLVIGRSTQTDPLSGSYAQTLIDMLPVAPRYVRLLSGIPPFHIDYSFMKGGHAIFSTPVLCGTALIVALAAVSVWTMRRPRWWLVGGGILWVGLFLLPVSNLLPMMQYMAERFLYLPLIGWTLALTGLLWFANRERLTVTVSTVTLLFWAATAWNRSQIWRDEITLFVQSSHEGPKTARVQENAVAAIFKLPHIASVYVRDPHNPKRLVIQPPPRPDDWRAVINTLLTGAETFPEDENVLTALGVAFARIGNPERAAEFFQRSAQSQPRSVNNWANLSQAYLEAGNYPSARGALTNALQIEPANVGHLRRLAGIYWRETNFVEALRVFELVAKLDPANSEDCEWIDRAKAQLAATP